MNSPPPSIAQVAGRQPSRILHGVVPILIILAATIFATHAQEPAPELPTVRIDYFFKPGCDDCVRIDTEVMPLLEQGYMDLCELVRWDLSVEENYLRLVGYMETLEIDANAHVYMIVDHTVALVGPDAIAERLFTALDEGITLRLEGTPPPDPPAPPAQTDEQVVMARMERFALAGIVIGGLVDGINPCAISTLIFLISVLSMARLSGRRLLLIGGAFCLASFITYTAIGFGLLHAVHGLYAFQRVRAGIDITMVVLLAILAVLSFRDAAAYRRTGDAGSVQLQLPPRVKQTIHRMLRGGFTGRAQVLSGFGIGAAVTALESVCTGQVYVPTLALVVKSGMAPIRGLLYLLIYNLLFVTPLIIVLVLTYHGLKVMDLMRWSKRNVALSKVLLGLFFAALAVTIALL